MRVVRVFAAAVAVGLSGVPGRAQQGFYREYYAGIEGNAVANLTNAPAFPDSPTAEEVVSGPLETGVNIAEAYGQRVRALLTPAVSGDYTFWIASDDASELWLGTGATPATRRRIAAVSGWTNARQWNKEAGQRSALVALVAGTPYYLEALQKEGGGGDNLAVAWQVPGTTTTNVIPAGVIAPYLDPPAIKTQPASAEVYAQWAGTQTVTFTVEPVRRGGIAYQWSRDGADIAGATLASLSLVADLANSNRLFRCRLTSLGGTVTSAAARYTLVPDTVAPSLASWSQTHDPRLLTLVFSEPLAPASATNAAAYAVNGLVVLSARLLEDGVTVVLTLGAPLVSGAAHALSLSVSDCAAPANTLTLSNMPFTPPPLTAVPPALLRPSPEPPGPSSRRTGLAVTEINHSPAARADGRDTRFVELYNSNPFPQPIGGYRFSGAFDYVVPTGTVLAANAYLAVAPAPADLAAAYGLANVLGGFDASGFDGASALTLNDELGAWLTTIAYSDEPPWPVAADGSGHTLVLARPSYGERFADGWSASARLGGSPGAAEPARDAAFHAVLLNEVLAHAGATPGFIELYNASSSAVSLAGCVLKRGDPASAGYRFPEGSTLAGRGFLALDEAALGFKINGLGGRLWLFAPESQGGFVIDATRLANQELGVAFGRFPDGAALWSRLASPTPAAANAPRRAAEVVLSELMYHPISEDSDDEYIELHNPGASAIDLAGWRLGGDVEYAFAETLPANGYLIVPHSRNKLAQLYPALTALMATNGYAGSLGNARGTVTLSRPAQVMNTDDPANPVVEVKRVVIEEAAYRDGGEWGALADGGGSSLERVDPRADPRLARSWAASDETQSSAWTTLAFTGVIDHGFTASANGDPNEVHIGLMDGGECLIDSVEVLPAGGANLVNNPSFEADTADWRFMGTHDRSTIETVPGAFDGSRALHLRASDRVQTGMNVIRGALSASLPVSGTGTIRARVRWLSGSPELLVRTRGNWLEASGSILTTRALGTPGAPNSRGRANGAPAISDVVHQPLLPRNGEKVTVYARIGDPDSLSKATLYYRVEGQAGTHAVAMAPCVGGYFAGEIPAGLPANALAAFYVEAADAHALTARSRYPSDAPARECLVRFNEPLDARAFGVYRFWMTQENIAYWATREKASNAPIGATFVYGSSRALYTAAMMYGGSPWHSGYTAPINNGNIDYEATFQNDDTLLDDDGMIIATVGNLGNDDIGIREQFCYSLVQSTGQPHMHRRYVHLYANGTEQNAKKIFEDTEKPNAGVLEHWFPEDANNDFFKIEDWFEYTLDITGFDIVTATLQKFLTAAPDGDGQVLKLGRYRWCWMKRGYETFRANDYTNLFGLVETLNLAEPSTYAQRLQEEVDIRSFASTLAMNRFIVNWDTYGYNRGKNMYLYDSDDGWALIAWDLDFNFGDAAAAIDPSLGSFPVNDPVIRKFLTTPVAARAYWRAVEQLLAAASDPALRALTRAKYDALRADAAVLNGSYDAFLASVDARRTFVAGQLAAVNPAGLAVTSPAGAFSTAALNVVTLAGVAPFAVTSLRINGAETPVTWTTPSNWTAQVILNNGTNAFQVQAFTADGSPLPGGGETRTIAYTGVPLDPLEGYLVISEIMPAPATNGAAYIEVANRSASTVMNLTGLTLEGDATFAFPAGAALTPGALAVVAEDEAAFSAAYGSASAARVVGAYSGALRAAGGQLRLKRPAAGFELDDAVLDAVLYEAADPWPAHVPPGTSLQLVNPAIDNNRVANWAAENTASEGVVQTPVPWNKTWAYYRTAYPGDTWAATNFNDAAWEAGAGPLGRELGTALPIPLATTFGLTGRLAYYFRTTFTFTGNPATAELSLTYMLDDAAAFYLNGQEIRRSSLMPLGVLTDASAATRAMEPEGQVEGPFALPATALRSGVNTLAVRVHQNVTGSSDLVFGMRLDITSTQASAATPGAANALNSTLSALPGVWLNEVQPLNASGPADNLGEREPWAELYNAETSAVDLAGWSLATASADPGWAFPAGTALSARSFLRVWLDGEAEETAAGHLHAGLVFAVTNGLLVLRAPVDGRTVAADYLRVTNAVADGVWGAYPDGASNPRRWLNPATPGLPNRSDKPARRIVVNEFMAQNDLYTNPLSGKKDDWFELFNDGTETVNLGGYVVTDTLASQSPPLPDWRATKSLVLSNAVALAPGQAVRIWTGASNASSLPFDPANLQAPFGLGKEGDQICLFNPATQLVDRLAYTTEQSDKASLGRWANGAEGDLVSFCQPTPGQPNRNPRFASAVLAQPPAFALREESPFCHTNAFAGERPAHFAFGLLPATDAPLPPNLSFDAATGVLSWTPSEAQGPGLYAFRVCGFLVDGPSVTACDEALLTLAVLEAPSRPLLGALTNLTVNEGALVTFTVTATRAEEIPPYPTQTALSLAGAVPTNATFDAGTGVFRWQTAEVDGPCTNAITVLAHDANDPDGVASSVVTVRVREVNSALVYRSPTAFELWHNEPFAVGLRFEDSDLPPNRITYTLLPSDPEPPPGMTLDPETGLLQWQPSVGQSGTFSAKVRANDNAGSALTRLVTWTVDTASLEASSFAVAPDAGRTLDLRWASKPGAFYTIEWSPRLTDASWQPVNPGAPVAGTGQTVSFSLSPAALGSPTNAYFRIRQAR